MEVKEIFALYYSATGNTCKAVENVAQTLAELLGIPVHTIDYTLPAVRVQTQEFHDKALVIVGSPVYAGRVPNKMLPYFQTQLTGNGALAVPMVTFGNRSFDNGLMELRLELEAHGFHTIAGAALPCQHAFSAALATGRPNPEDIQALKDFAGKIADKIAALACPPAPISVPGDNPVGPYYRPLGIDGQPAVFLKAKPKTNPEKCNHCGICAQGCPMGSISLENPTEVPGICIKCQHCIHTCPNGAKYFDDERFLSHVAMLEQNYTRPMENQFFF